MVGAAVSDEDVCAVRELGSEMPIKTAAQKYHRGGREVAAAIVPGTHSFTPKRQRLGLHFSPKRCKGIIYRKKELRQRAGPSFDMAFGAGRMTLVTCVTSTIRNILEEQALPFLCAQYLYEVSRFA